TQAGFDLPDHVIDECHVLAAGVAPTVADALRRDKDRVALAVLVDPQPVVGPLDTAGAAVVDLFGGAADPVEREDQPVRVIAVVVVRQPQDVAAVLATALDGVRAAGERGCPAAPGRARRRAGTGG